MERENLHGDAKGKAQAASTARPKVPMRRLGGGLLRLKLLPFSFRSLGVPRPVLAKARRCWRV